MNPNGTASPSPLQGASWTTSPQPPARQRSRRARNKRPQLPPVQLREGLGVKAGGVATDHERPTHENDEFFRPLRYSRRQQSEDVHERYEARAASKDGKTDATRCRARRRTADRVCAPHALPIATKSSAASSTCSSGSSPAERQSISTGGCSARIRRRRRRHQEKVQIRLFAPLPPVRPTEETRRSDPERTQLLCTYYASNGAENQVLDEDVGTMFSL